MQQVVIGIIRNAAQQVLIAQRAAHQAKGGMWEFPGGKVEPTESPFVALQRELAEELGIDVIAAESWLRFEYHYPHAHVLLDVWLIKEFLGTPRGAEGQPVKWISFEEFSDYEFPEGNRRIIDALVTL